MSDFELFDQILEKDYYGHELFHDPLQCEEEAGQKIECSHESISDTAGVILCTDCGEEIAKNIKHDKEWRYYGQMDTKYSSDPNRCHLRKIEDKSIFKDVETMGFSDKIIAMANKIYIQVTGGKIHRGNSRKAIVFACIFHAYKLSGRPQACESLIDMFDLDRKTGLRGLKHVNLKIPKDSITHTSHITPANLVDDIMNKFMATEEQKKEVVDLYEQIKNKSSKINRARPQSIAAGLTFYWININHKNISIKEFIEKVNLSELTITRISKEISAILEQKD